MTRRTFADVAAEARDCERDAAIDLIRDKIVEVEALAAKRRIPAVEADLLTRRLDAVADALAANLHRPDAKRGKQ
jgi:hypothetical protein